jgi:hypothetical protein
VFFVGEIITLFSWPLASRSSTRRLVAAADACHGTPITMIATRRDTAKFFHSPGSVSWNMAFDGRTIMV